MKTIYNYFLNKKNVILTCMVLIVMLICGCKKNNDAIDSSLIESKLTNGNSQQWKAPIALTYTSCAGATTSVLITFSSDHKFIYNGNCSFNGSWNAEYSSNRAGQFLLLNLTYFNGTFYQTDIYSLKYSSEQDIFYALDTDTQELYPFVRYNFAP